MYHHLKNLHLYSTRSLLEESSKKSISKVSGVGARPTRQRLQPARDCRPGGHHSRRLPKDALDQIANQRTHLFSPLLGASWLAQRDEYWVIDQAPERHAPRRYLPGLPAARRLPLSALTDPT